MPAHVPVTPCTTARGPVRKWWYQNDCSTQSAWFGDSLPPYSNRGVGKESPVPGVSDRGTGRFVEWRST